MSAADRPAFRQWQAVAATRQGPHAAENQDAYLARPEVGVFAVADGMGGHSQGRLASRTVIEMIDLVIDREHAVEARLAALEQAIQDVGNALHERGRRQDPPVTSGTTLALVAVEGQHAITLWAGDSRVYLSAGGTLRRLSRDHTIANALGVALRDGVQGHALTRAVGPYADVQLERSEAWIEPGEALLLCTDGLIKAVTETEIAAVLATLDATVADRLVAAARALGARDDVTVVVAWPLV